MKRLFFVIVVTFLTISGLFVGRTLSQNALQNSEQKKVVIPSINAKQQETAQKLWQKPDSLSIPKIGVDAPIESVGQDAKGNMDVPKEVQNVAWYNLGAKPGERGNAVIAGHFDDIYGNPAVFYKLVSLEPGDKITVTDESKSKYTYRVYSIEDYPYNDFPLQHVFGETQEYNLNLITCEGTFNQQTKNYSHRTVVYARLSP